MTTWMAITLAKMQINHISQPCYISNKITDFQVSVVAGSKDMTSFKPNVCLFLFCIFCPMLPMSLGCPLFAAPLVFFLTFINYFIL